jgi:ATP-dependent DNA helicase RecQ
MRRVVTRKEKTTKPRRGASGGLTSQPNAVLLDKLKDWRFVQAQSQSVPAFVIFHDSTLAGIAAANPRTLDELSGISGIGAKKLERYGTAILDLLHDG